LKLNSKREREKDVVVQALVQQRIPLMNGDEMLKVFIAKFDVQPWDLTHQVGYLSLSSPSVCAIFYNSENVNVLEIRIVNPRFYFIPRVIMCTYMLIIFFMVLVLLNPEFFVSASKAYEQRDKL
jgi:hypothetical protein